MRELHAAHLELKRQKRLCCDDETFCWILYRRYLLTVTLTEPNIREVSGPKPGREAGVER